MKLARVFLLAAVLSPLAAQASEELGDGRALAVLGAVLQDAVDRPDQPVPLWLAGSGPAATRFAGRVGDGYITTSGKAPDRVVLSTASARSVPSLTSGTAVDIAVNM